MKKFLAPKILIPIVGTIVLIGAMAAYILFAPSTWWKPIYIQFDAQEASANTSTPQAATTENLTPEKITPPPQLGHLEPANAAPQLIMP